VTISADLQSLTPGNIVTLYELDTRPIGGFDQLFFHEGSNPIGETVIWGGKQYVQFPIEATGFEKNGNGSLPRPRLRAANVDGLLGQLTRELRGLEGAKLVRTRTFVKYLDAANFPGGVNPSADTSQYIEREIWFVSRKSQENRMILEYELASSFDVSGVKLPRRQVIQNACPWGYRSSECGYTGGPVANLLDQPVVSIQEDNCGKRLSSCKLRFGESAILPFGGFPGAGLTR
jgi:lambda family phage minor tail protein L